MDKAPGRPKPPIRPRPFRNPIEPLFLISLCCVLCGVFTASRIEARVGDGSVSLTWSGVASLTTGESPLAAGAAISDPSRIAIVLLAPGGERNVPLDAAQPARFAGIDPGVCRIELRNSGIEMAAWEVTVVGELSTDLHLDLSSGRLHASDVFAEPFGNWERWDVSELRILPGLGSEALEAVDTHAPRQDPNLDGRSLDRPARLRPQEIRLDRRVAGAQTPLGTVPAFLKDDRRWILTRPAPRTQLTAAGSGGTAGRFLARGAFDLHTPSAVGMIDLSTTLQYALSDNAGPTAVADDDLEHNQLEGLEARIIGHLAELGPGALRASIYAHGTQREYYLHPFELNLPHAPREDRAWLEATGTYDLDIGPSLASLDLSFTRDYLETGDDDAFDVFGGYTRSGDSETTEDGLSWQGDDPTNSTDDGHLYDYYLRSLTQSFRVALDTQTDWSSSPSNGENGVGFAPLRLGAELRTTSWRLFEHLAPTQAALGLDSGFQMTQNYGYSLDGDERDSRSGHEPRDPSELALYTSQRMSFGSIQLEGGARFERFVSGQRPLLDLNDPVGDDGTITDADLAAEEELTAIDPRAGLYAPLGSRTHLWIDGGRTRTYPPFEALYFDSDLLQLQAGTDQGEERFGREFLFGNPALAPEERWSGQVGIHRDLTRELGLRISGTMARVTDTWVARAHPIGIDQIAYYENEGERRESGLHTRLLWRAGTRSSLRLSYDWSQIETNVIEPAPLYRELTNPGEPVQNIAHAQSPLGYSSWLEDGVDRGFFPSILDRTHRLSAAWILELARANSGFAQGLLAPGQLAVTLQAASGLPYTPTFVRAEGSVVDALDPARVIPGSLNSERLPWMWQVDVALTQNLELFDHEVGLLVEVRNLTNNQNAHTVYTATGEADDDGWLDTPEGQAAVEQNGDEFERAYLDRIDDPTHYRDGIQGRLGLSVHF